MPVIRKILALICLVLPVTLTVQAQFLTVWPGDANANGGCTHVDLLQIGQAFSLTGPPRNTQAYNWQPYSATPWAGAPVQTNAAHSDCNGDGEVAVDDILALGQNFGLGTGVLVRDDTSFGTAFDPEIRVNLIQDTVLVQGTTSMTLNLELGTSTNPVDSIYGFALTISYDPNIVDDISLTFTGGFIADSSSLLFARTDTVAGKIYLAITRTDHANRAGYGSIASIGIVMDDDIRITGQWDLLFQPIHALGLTASEALVYVYPRGDTLTVLTGAEDRILGGIDIYPNPANDRVTIRSQHTNLQALRLVDVQGRLVTEKSNLNSAFEILETDRLAPGCYFLQVHTDSGTLRKKLIIQSN